MPSGSPETTRSDAPTREGASKGVHPASPLRSTGGLTAVQIVVSVAFSTDILLYKRCE